MRGEFVAARFHVESLHRNKDAPCPLGQVLNRDAWILDLIHEMAFVRKLCLWERYLRFVYAPAYQTRLTNSSLVWKYPA